MELRVVFLDEQRAVVEQNLFGAGANGVELTLSYGVETLGEAIDLFVRYFFQGFVGETCVFEETELSPLLLCCSEISFLFDCFLRDYWHTWSCPCCFLCSFFKVFLLFS